MNNCNVPTSYYLLSFNLCPFEVTLLTNVHDTYCELHLSLIIVLT